jgi:hypothetical protein
MKNIAPLERPSELMFVVTGRKIVAHRLGYVADFCPICRSIQPFKLVRVGSARQFYAVPLGKGELIGYERVCRDCGVAVKADPNLYFFIAGKRGSLEDLIIATFPGIKDALKTRLGLEDRVRRDPSGLKPDERQPLLLEPFMALSPKVEGRFSSFWAITVDANILFSMAGMIVGGGIGEAIIGHFYPDKMASVMNLLAWLGIAFVAWQIMGSGRRFMRNRIAPVVARALKPLKPTEAELETVLEELRRNGYQIGKRLFVKDLAAAWGS